MTLPKNSLGNVIQNKIDETRGKGRQI